MNQKILIYYKLVIYSILMGISNFSNAQSNGKPNIIIILADDLGYGDLSCYGATKVQTPAIDQLAREGIRFTDAHSPAGTCSPSRYSLLTGIYPWRYPPLNAGVLNYDTLSIRPDQPTIASMLKSKGYATAAIGKWHLGWGDELPTNWNEDLSPGPLAVGFDYYYGVPSVNSIEPKVFVENNKVVNLDPDDPIEIVNPHKMTGGEAARYEPAFIDEKSTDKAIEWINENKGDPFFLYFNTVSIHTPIVPHPKFRGTSEAGDYGDFIHTHDWCIGRILDTLDQLQLSDKTIVIYSSDNGAIDIVKSSGYPDYKINPNVTTSGLYNHYPNANLKGQKSDIWEGGNRVPLIIRWPNQIKGGREVGELVGLNDIFATISDILDVPLQKNMVIDSKSIAPIIFNEKKAHGRTNLVLASHGGIHAIRENQWIFIDGQGSGGISSGGGWSGAGYKPQENEPPGQLYNLENDLKEQKNLYNDYPELVEKLKARLYSIEHGYPME